MQSGRRGDVDDGPGLAVLNAEVWCGGTGDLEGRTTVQGKNRVPLLVGCLRKVRLVSNLCTWPSTNCGPNLVENTVPGETCIVDNDVDLAIAELGRALDQLVDICVVQQVAGHGQRTSARLVDLLCDLLRLFWSAASAIVPHLVLSPLSSSNLINVLTGIDVADDHLCTFISKEPRCFGTNPLRGARDDGDLAGKQALGVVKVGGNLPKTAVGGHFDVVCLPIVWRRFVQLKATKIGIEKHRLSIKKNILPYMMPRTATWVE